jgi:hypothetical protein
MKTTTKIISLLLLLSTVFISCEKDKITYYKAIGEGYVFAYDTMNNLLYPLEGVEVSVLTSFDERRGNFLESEPIEYFFSDAIGKYQVRFIKQKQNWGNADRYDFHIYYYVYINGKWLGNATNFTIGVDKVKNAQHTIELDTFKVYIEY